MEDGKKIGVRFFGTAIMLAERAARWALMWPIIIYRYSLSAFVGRQCRHEPSCSLYALDAIKLNGAWKGFWLTLSRIYRCGPGGSHGFDPAPDLRGVRHPIYKCWKYGVWRKG